MLKSGSIAEEHIFKAPDSLPFSSQLNLSADVEAMADLLFTESFSRLTALQQQVLFAISLFAGGTSLTALYQVK